MPPTVVFYLLMALALFGSGAATGWKVVEWKNESDKAAAVQAQAMAQAAEDARAAKIAASFRQGILSLKATNQANDTKAATELAQKIYHDCVLPDSGRVLIDSGADDINSALGFSTAVPAAPALAGKSGGAVGHGGSVSSAQDFAAAVRELRARAAKTSAAADREPKGSTTK
jgi:hypothetical protein